MFTQMINTCNTLAKKTIFHKEMLCFNVKNATIRLLYTIILNKRVNMKSKFNKNYFLSLLSFLIPVYVHASQPNTVIATINTGITPAGIAVTPDSRFIYVANNNNYGLSGEDSVSVLDTTTNLLAHTITDPSFNQPYTVTMSPDGTKAYVTNSNGTTISIINTFTNSVVGTITGLNGPSGLVINPTTNIGYVNNYGTGNNSGTGTTISTIDLNNNTITGQINVGLAPSALAISPHGEFVYVTNYVDGNPGTGTMSVVDTMTGMVVDTITGFFGPFAVAVTPDGNHAYVTNFGSNNFSPIGSTVSVVDLNSHMIVGTVDVGLQPSGIAITPDGRFAYVSNYNTLYAGPNFTDLTPGQGTVNIIDTATNTVVPPTIAVGQSPDAITISPDGLYAYVTNFTSGTVSVIALQSFQITAKGCKLKRKCSKKGDRINKLTWEASGSSLPVSYSLYRDAGLTDLIATVPGSQSKYFDHVSTKQNTYTYYLTGTNEAGTTSEAVKIVVSRKCEKCK